MLLLAGYSKLLDPATFQLAIFDYKIVSFGLAGITAAYLPAIELVVGFALLFRLAPLGSAIMATALYALFIFVLSFALLKGTVTECGCFGILSLSPAFSLALDVCLLCLAVLTTITEIRFFSRTPAYTHPETV